MLGFPGLAHFPAVIDENVGETAPSLLGEHALNVLFDLVGILLVRQPKPQGEPLDMGVHDDTGNVKYGAKHAVRGLPPNSWKS